MRSLAPSLSSTRSARIPLYLLDRRGHQLNDPRFRLREILLRPLQDLFFLSEENHLPFFADFPERVEDSLLSPSVALQRDVIEDQRAYFGRFCQIFHQGKPQQEIDVFGRSMGEARDIAPFAVLIADLDLECLGIHAGIYITLESDFGQPLADDFGQEWSNIAVNAVLSLTEEQMGRFQRVIQHPNVG